MVKAEDGAEVYENQIESLFMQYCYDNNLTDDLEKRKINDNDAYCIWVYIYNILFKPDRNTVRLNNKTSKIDYSDIYSIWDVLNTYIQLCFDYKKMEFG